MSRNHPSERCPELDRRAFLSGLAGTSLFAFGCGADTYETRLKETRSYFEYLEKVNLALGPKTSLAEGIEIRVPKPFEMLTLPAPPAEGQPAEPPPAPSEDPNLLGYRPNVHLDGVIASWKANVKVDAPRQSDAAEVPAYLHLLSNLSLWEEKQTNNDIDPLHYLNDLTNKLANAYNVATDTSDAPWPWVEIGSRDDERYRAFSPYIAKKEDHAKKTERRKVEYIDIPPEDQPINAVFYKMEVKDVQIALLLIFPRNIDPSVHLEGRMKYTLEWLKVPAQPPAKKTSKPAASSIF